MWKRFKEKLKGKHVLADTGGGVFMDVDRVLYKDDPRYAVLKTMIDDLHKENADLRLALRQSEYERARLERMIKEGV